MRGKAFVVTFGTYPFSMLVSIGQSNEARRYAAKTKLNERICKSDSELGDRVGYVLGLKSGNCLLVMCPCDDSAEWFGFLAHEIFHAVEIVFRNIDLPLGAMSSEAYAYQVSYLTTEIYKRL